MARPILQTATFADLPAQLAANTAAALRWVRTDSLEAGIGVTAAAALYLLFFGIRWGALRLIGKGHSVATWRGFAWRVVRRTRSFFLAMLGTHIVVQAVDAPAGLARFVAILFTISAAVQMAVWVREIVIGAVERRAALSEEQGEDRHSLDSAIGIIKVLVNFTVWALALVLVLSNLGIDVTALVAGLGVGGIAIGLAAQGIFGDLFAALAILFDRPFRVGDTISFGGGTAGATNSGTVEAIGLKTTRIRALSGEQLIVSNSKLLDQQISNLRRIEERRVVQTYLLTLDSDLAALAAVPAMLETIAGDAPQVRFDRAHVSNVTATAVEVELVYYVTAADLVATMDARQAVVLGALAAFRKAGLRLADTTPRAGMEDAAPPPQGEEAR